MIKKQLVLKTLNELPEEFDVEVFMDRLILLHKIEQGLEQSENGETLSMEEAKIRLSKWLK